jgi:hypothetical protein
MEFDLYEIVQFDRKPVSLFTAVRRVTEAPAAKRLARLSVFREAGKDRSIFRAI